MAGEGEHEAAQRLELEGQHLLELLLRRADEPALPPFELHGDPPEHGGEHGQHLRGLRLVQAVFRQAGKVVDAVGDLPPGDGHDAHLRGPLGHRVQGQGVHPHVAAGARGCGGLGRSGGRGSGRRNRFGDRYRLGSCREIGNNRIGDNRIGNDRRRRGGRLDLGLGLHLWNRGGTQQRHQLLVHRRLDAPGDGLDQRRQLVHHPRQQGDHPRPGRVQNLLGRVAQLGQGADLHHPPRPFERVQLALDLHHRLGVGLQVGDAGGEPLQAVAGFLYEEGYEIGELRVHSRPGVRSWSNCRR